MSISVPPPIRSPENKKTSHKHKLDELSQGYVNSIQKKIKDRRRNMNKKQKA